MQLGHEFTATPSKVTGSTSSVKVRLRIWVRTRWRVSDQDNSRSVSGNWPSASGNQSINHTGNDQTTKVYDETITVNTSYSGTVKRSFSASLSGIAASPGTVTASGSYTVAKRPPRAPTAPTYGSTSRPSATSARATWTNRPSTAGPITRNRFQAYNNINKKWVTVSTPGATATQATASGLTMNALYELRIRAEGPGGNSGWVEAGTFATTPAAPSNIVAKKVGQNIEVSLTDNAARTERTRRFRFYDHPDGGAAVQVGDRSMNNMPFVHSNPDPAKTHRYRVTAEITSFDTWVSGMSSYSNTVQLQAPPNAPTVRGPSSVRDRDGNVTLQWTHNPVDTTSQTEAEVRYTLPGEQEDTITVTGDAQQVTIPAGGASGNVTWDVRTRGDHANFGPRSSKGTFLLAQVPEVVIQNTDTEVESAVAEVEWLISVDDGTQGPWAVELLDAEEQVLEDTSGSGGTTAHTFRYVLEDEQTYGYRVQVTSSTGLESEPDVFWFTTDFPLPQAATPVPEWDLATGSVSVGFDVHDPTGDETVAVAAGVYRRDPGGEWVFISGVSDWDDTVQDLFPHMDSPEYRILTQSEAGAARWGDTVTATRDQGLWPAYLTAREGLILQIWDNLRPSMQQERGKTRRRWAGRERPTTKWGQHRSEAWTLPFTLSPRTPGDTQLADVLALEDSTEIVCYRDVLGSKVFCTVDSVAVDVVRDGRYSLTVSVTREEKHEDTRTSRVGDPVLGD